MRHASLQVRALSGVPEITAGSDLAGIARDALEADGIRLEPRDVLVFAQKVVSKAEGRLVDLRTVTATARAVELAAVTGKDPRFVEAVLAESSEVVRATPNVLITRHRLGFVMANAGIDRSNTGVKSSADFVLLLPLDPDGTAVALRAAMSARCGVAPAVIISDSFGRPWRQGVVNVALGVAGIPAIVDLRGNADREGRTLQVTQVALADAIAAAAGLVMGEAHEGSPIVHVRGLEWSAPDSDGQALVRPVREDLFR